MCRLCSKQHCPLVSDKGRASPLCVPHLFHISLRLSCNSSTTPPSQHPPTHQRDSRSVSRGCPSLLPFSLPPLSSSSSPSVSLQLITPLLSLILTALSPPWLSVSPPLHICPSQDRCTVCILCTLTVFLSLYIQGQYLQYCSTVRPYSDSIISGTQ